MYLVKSERTPAKILVGNVFSSQKPFPAFRVTAGGERERKRKNEGKREREKVERERYRI